jgi:F420-0:gamma-glutamyl ligase-like protein
LFLAAIPNDVLAGWVASPDRVYIVVGGYFTSISFALLLFAHGSHVFALFLDRFR